MCLELAVGLPYPRTAGQEAGLRARTPVLKCREPHAPATREQRGGQNTAADEPEDGGAPRGGEVRPFPDPRLTPDSARCCAVIRDSVERRGYPPSVREIGDAVGPDLHLIGRPPTAHPGAQGLPAPRPEPHPRGRRARPGRAPAAPTTSPRSTRRRRDWQRRLAPAPAFVPVVGRIAAGGPILAEQAVEERVPAAPRDRRRGHAVPAATSRGDSMVDAAITDGDWVVVRQQPVAENGEIVAAMIDGEATVKTFRRRDGHIWLMPAQPRLRADPRRRRHGARPGGRGAAPPVIGASGASLIRGSARSPRDSGRCARTHPPRRRAAAGA